MRVLCFGSRKWTDVSTIELALRDLGHVRIVYHGNQRGADRLSHEAAFRLWIPVQAVPAHWARFGRAAGPIRNRELVSLRPDVALSFQLHEDFESFGPGSRDMTRQLRAEQIPIYVLTPGDRLDIAS